ncbi:MAG TPA: MmgE/PrpD family protein, partial [Pyrinomonadaceae bacterium]|nr:MmgE/PrpD family protein [Pyrinomonadaceae bacterium]
MIINRKSNKFNPATKTAAFVLLLALMLTNVVSLNVYAQTSTQQKTTGLLAKYTTDLTALAKNNEIRPSASFDREVDRLATALSEGGQQQPVILDAVGKDELLVVEALAGRIADGRAGEGLKGTRVLKLDVDTLFDQKKDANEVIRTLDGIFIELRAENRNTILFVDELANFVGNSRVSDSLTAALVNGTAAHGFELDDTHDETMSHPGCTVIPAALAVAAEVGASQRQLLGAIAAGYETIGRIGLLCNAMQMVERGFHPTALLG